MNAPAMTSKRLRLIWARRDRRYDYRSATDMPAILAVREKRKAECIHYGMDDRMYDAAATWLPPKMRNTAP
jgi:hypothetical protein